MGLMKAQDARKPYEVPETTPWTLKAVEHAIEHARKLNWNEIQAHRGVNKPYLTLTDEARSALKKAGYEVSETETHEELVEHEETNSAGMTEKTQKLEVVMGTITISW